MARTYYGILCIMALLGVLATEAKADPPDTKEVVYKFHTDPDDPNSPLNYTIQLTLSSEDVDGAWVGWSIAQIEVREIAADQQSYTAWIDTNPSLSLPDDLWWVKHADLDNPQLNEFSKPPGISGTASAEITSDDDLDYIFEWAGLTSTGPWTPNARLKYEFTLASESVPFAESMDDPAEVDDPENPPA